MAPVCNQVWIPCCLMWCTGVVWELVSEDVSDSGNITWSCDGLRVYHWKWKE